MDGVGGVSQAHSESATVQYRRSKRAADEESRRGSALVRGQFALFVVNHHGVFTDFSLALSTGSPYRARQISIGIKGSHGQESHRPTRSTHLVQYFLRILLQIKRMSCDQTTLASMTEHRYKPSRPTNSLVQPCELSLFLWPSPLLQHLVVVFCRNKSCI